MDDKLLLALPIGFLTGIAPLFALPCALALPTMAFYLIWMRKSIHWESSAQWALGAFLGGLVTVHCYPWDHFFDNVILYQNLYNKVAVTPLGLSAGWKVLLTRSFLVSDMDLFRSKTVAAPFFWLLFGAAILRIRRSIASGYAMCLWISYIAFSMSSYPIILIPFFLVGACG